MMLPIAINAHFLLPISLILICLITLIHSSPSRTIECTSFELLHQRDYGNEPWRAVNTEKKTCRAEWCIFIEGVGVVKKDRLSRQTAGRMYGCSNEHINKVCSRIGDGNCGRTENLYDVLTGDFRLCCCRSSNNCNDKIEAKFVFKSSDSKDNQSNKYKNLGITEDNEHLDIDVNIYEDQQELRMERHKDDKAHSMALRPDYIGVYMGVVVVWLWLWRAR